MPLTRPRFSQFDTTISSVSDPVTVLNKSSTLANIDVGFIMNRNGGALSNVAVFWQESANTFALAFTTSTGEVPNANISISTYANLQVNTLNTTFVNAIGNVSAAQINSATAVVTGSAFFGELFVKSPGGDEGGQLNLAPAVTNTTLAGNVVIDVFQNKLRIFEGGGTARGGYFDISGLAAGVATNLAGGGGGTPGGGEGQLQFNSSSAFAGAASLYYFGANGAIVANAGIASTSTTTGTMQITGGVGISGNVWADRIHAVNNGTGTNFRVGDDLWLGDINVANTMRLMGAQDNTQAFIRFGNTNTSTLGVSGSGPLSWGGVLNVTGNVLGATASFGTINSTGLINTTGNILSTGLSVFGNTRIGSLAIPGALHTIIGNVDVTGAGTEYFNIAGNILAVQASFGSINSTGLINTSGNVSGAVVNTGALNVTGTSTVAAVTSTGFINTSGNVSAAVHTGGAVSVTGFINTSSNVSAAIGSFNSITVRAAVTAIANGGTSGVGNIGATGATFNTVFAKATTAQYADLAEVYTSDQQYPGGTVVVFGGESEVTQSHSPHDTRIAGVVSTNPAYLMNHNETGVPVALQGRVPCRVLGPVSKGDRVVASHIPGVAQALDPAQYQPGCIIGKALQAIDSTDISIIEVVVGRL